jgi:hypothetical protein
MNTKDNPPSVREDSEMVARGYHFERLFHCHAHRVFTRILDHSLSVWLLGEVTGGDDQRVAVAACRDGCPQIDDIVRVVAGGSERVAA